VYQVGFGVSGQHIEHKDIPLIVSRLLQYASSENRGGGGIAMMTAVAVVGRAIEFFAKEGNRVVTSDAAAVDSSNATLARVLQ
jgi:hypothetical protein